MHLRNMFKIRAFIINIRDPFRYIFAWVIITMWSRFDISMLIQTEYNFRVGHLINQYNSGKNATNNYTREQMFI